MTQNEYGYKLLITKKKNNLKEKLGFCYCTITRGINVVSPQV